MSLVVLLHEVYRDPGSPHPWMIICILPGPRWLLASCHHIHALDRKAEKRIKEETTDKR
jgi:hypothetical protein